MVSLFNLRCRNQGLVSLFCCNLYLYFLIVDTMTTSRLEFVVSHKLVSSRSANLLFMVSKFY